MKHLLIHTPKKFVLSVYSVLVTLIGTGDIVMNKTDRIPCLLGAHILLWKERQKTNKQTSKHKIYSMSAGHRVTEAIQSREGDKTALRL